MNKTKIEWTDYTWNPVTGCWGPGGTAEKPNRCSYCYAHKVARRYGIRGYTPKVESWDPFQPYFYPERLDQPAKVKKPSRIFVCSMADLFGDWVLREWIEAVLNRTQRADYSHHIYQFLTKNPKRLQEFNPWPSNCWVGTTVTNQADADERIPELLKADAPVRFASCEPFLGPIDLGKIGYPKEPIKTAPFWFIIGAQTGPGAVKPDPNWIQSLINQAQAARVLLFLKDNLNWPEKIQEFPSRGKGEG